MHARLIAKVNMIHFNTTTNETCERSYHFASYKSEIVDDCNEFYQRHMMKIASRMDSFNQNGSNCLYKKYCTHSYTMYMYNLLGKCVFRWKTNPKMYQHPKTDTCGVYSLYFILNRFKHPSLKSFTDTLSNSVNSNETHVQHFYNELK